MTSSTQWCERTPAWSTGEIVVSGSRSPVSAVHARAAFSKLDRCEPYRGCPIGVTATSARRTSTIAARSSRSPVSRYRSSSRYPSRASRSSLSAEPGGVRSTARRSASIASDRPPVSPEAWIRLRTRNAKKCRPSLRPSSSPSASATESRASRTASRSTSRSPVSVNAVDSATARLRRYFDRDGPSVVVSTAARLSATASCRTARSRVCWNQVCRSMPPLLSRLASCSASTSSTRAVTTAA